MQFFTLPSAICLLVGLGLGALGAGAFFESKRREDRMVMAAIEGHLRDQRSDIEQRSKECSRQLQEQMLFSLRVGNEKDEDKRLTLLRDWIGPQGKLDSVPTKPYAPRRPPPKCDPNDPLCGL